MWAWQERAVAKEESYLILPISQDNQAQPPGTGGSRCAELPHGGGRGPGTTAGSCLLGPLQVRPGGRESSELGESGENRFGIWRMEKKTLETHKEELVVGQTVIYWGLLKRTRDLWALESLLRGHLRSGSVFPCDSDLVREDKSRSVSQSQGSPLPCLWPPSSHSLTAPPIPSTIAPGSITHIFPGNRGCCPRPQRES